MKGTLEFNLPEEQSLFNMYLKAIEYHGAIEDFRNQLRRWDKDDHEPSLAQVREVLYKILTEINFE